MISTDIKSLETVSHQKAHPNIGKILMTTDDYPIHYRMITKCGCTFLINVIHYLNYGYIYPEPDDIHRIKGNIPNAAAQSNAEIANSPYSFIVIRDPVSRFMSLYFDKIYGPPKRSEKIGLGAYFVENGFVDPKAGSDIGRHRDNCIRSIQWIRKNLNGETDREKNFHWKPQRNRIRQVRNFNFNVLMLEDINFQLSRTLKPLIPQIDEMLRTVSEQNISSKPVKPEDVLNGELRELIIDTYRSDVRIYREVSNYWHKYKEEH